MFIEEAGDTTKYDVSTVPLLFNNFTICNALIAARYHINAGIDPSFQCSAYRELSLRTGTHSVSMVFTVIPIMNFPVLPSQKNLFPCKIYGEISSDA
jgi:hypothetical protein